MHLGIFGGSFDPVHNGHLGLAHACQREALLHEVWFMPVAVQPLKYPCPQASDAHRIEMLRLAIDWAASEPGRPRPRSWRVCTLEIDRGGLSYTVDTLRQIHEELPEATLFFLIGADILRDVPRWKEPAEIFRLATPLVVRRAGEPEPDLRALADLCAENQPGSIEMPPINVSSSEVRRRIASGEPIDDLVPPPVASYVHAHALYQ